MTKSKKTRKNSGRFSVKYNEKFPFNFRIRNDILDERILWNDWNDYRDGQRNYFNPFQNKGKLRKKYQYLYKDGTWNLEEKVLINRLKKWSKKEKIRKLMKTKQKCWI
ncbi:MAG: hypothetical protein ACOCXG_04775 [Nanoarchaeota archaeon]